MRMVLYQAARREQKIEDFVSNAFAALLARKNPNKTDGPYRGRRFRLGFDFAASGQGDLATIYIDEREGDGLWLRGLFTCRAEDWHFLKTVLCYFLEHLPHVQAAGDESGLGRQICWPPRSTPAAPKSEFRREET